MNRFLEKIAADISSEKVKKYLNKNYPADTLKWVSKTEWVEKDVPLSQIKMARRPGGPREKEKVAGIAKAFQEKKPMEPVVLVRNGKGELKIADGYHRTMGCEKSGKRTIKAWVGKTTEEKGPWDKEMHERKLNVGKAAFETFEEFEKEASLLGGIARLGGSVLKSGAKDVKNFGTGITGMGTRKAKKNLNELKSTGTASPLEIKDAKKSLTGERWNQAKSVGIAGVGLGGYGVNKALKAGQETETVPSSFDEFNQERQFSKVAAALIESGKSLVPEYVKENQVVNLAQSEQQRLAQHNLRSMGIIGLGRKIYENEIKKEN